MAKSIKTIIISGFLGCGKTELVNQFLTQYSKENIVIIENEVAGLGIDGKVSNNSHVEVIEINDGSISTVNLNNLRKVLKDVIFKNPDLLIIETSGATNLRPVLALTREFKSIIPYVISVIDAERFSKAQKLSSHTLGHVAGASAVILNKCDLISKEEKQKQIRNLKHLHLEIVQATKCKVDLKKLLSKISPVNTIGLQKPKSESEFLWEIKKHWKSLKNRNERHQNINAYVHQSYGIINVNSLKNFLVNSKIPRAKGFVYIIEDNQLTCKYFSFVNKHFLIENAPSSESKPFNQIVLIGESIFADRSILKSKLDTMIKKSFSNKLSDFGWYLMHQQRETVRIVKLK